MEKLVLTEEETILADAARGFIEGSAPISHMRALRDAGKTQDPDLWQSMVDMGWAGVLIAEEQGGSDMGIGAACALAAEMGKTLTNSPFISTAVIAAKALREDGGTHALDMLSEIAKGAITYALAIDEGPKFAPNRIETTAEAVGNGFRLNGRKSFVVDGGNADRLLVVAKTENGLTLFDIAADAAGVETTAQDMIDSRAAASITLNNVEATGDNIIGTLDGGDAILRRALAAGQTVLAAEMSGLAQGAFGMTLGYLKDRKQFGVPIGSFQALQHRAAHLWCETEVTQSAILHAARKLDHDPENADMAVSLAKARATQTAQLAVQEGVQMHGGIGMTDDYDIGLFMKRARVATEWLGDYGYHAKIVAQHRGF